MILEAVHARRTVLGSFFDVTLRRMKPSTPTNAVANEPRPPAAAR